MPVSTQVVTAVRTWLLADDQEAVGLISRLGDADAQVYGLLLQAVLSRAAGRRFAAGYNDGDVIRYVAKVRAGTDVRTQDLDLDPKAAEAVLRHALGKATPLDADAQTQMRALMALLTVMLSELALDESDLDSLLAEARAHTDRWLAQSTPDGGT